MHPPGIRASPVLLPMHTPVQTRTHICTHRIFHYFPLSFSTWYNNGLMGSVSHITSIHMSCYPTMDKVSAWPCWLLDIRLSQALIWLWVPAHVQIGSREMLSLGQVWRPLAELLIGECRSHDTKFWPRDENRAKEAPSRRSNTNKTEFKFYFYFENFYFHCRFYDNRDFIQVITTVGKSELIAQTQYGIPDYEWACGSQGRTHWSQSQTWPEVQHRGLVEGLHQHW